LLAKKIKNTPNREAISKLLFGIQRVSKFLLRIKHLPTAVYINGSGSGWYIKKVNAKL
jgi:hypothetical protein